jgi:hypothetical protein
MIENKRIKFLVLVMLALILPMPSCQSSGEEAIATIDSSPTSNSPGEIRGVVLDIDGDRIRNRPIALALVAVDQEAAQSVRVDDETWIKVLGTGIETKTDINGEFLLTEVPPGEYVLLVYTDEIHSLKNAEGSAIFKLSGGEALDVGRVSIWKTE